MIFTHNLPTRIIWLEQMILVTSYVPPLRLPQLFCPLPVDTDIWRTYKRSQIPDILWFRGSACFKNSFSALLNVDDINFYFNKSQYQRCCRRSFLVYHIFSFLLTNCQSGCLLQHWKWFNYSFYVMFFSLHKFKVTENLPN